MLYRVKKKSLQETYLSGPCPSTMKWTQIYAPRKSEVKSTPFFDELNQLNSKYIIIEYWVPRKEGFILQLS